MGAGEAIIDFNRQREKTFSQRMAEAEEIEAIIRERAELERREKISHYRKTGETVEIFPQSKDVKSRDKVADKIGISSEFNRPARRDWFPVLT